MVDYPPSVDGSIGRVNPQKPVSLNLNVRGMGQSATVAVKAKCRELRDRGRCVYDFGLGQSPFPVPTPVVEALRLAAPEKDYLPVKGLPALREAVAEFHRRKDQIGAHPDRVLVGPGSKELMFLWGLADGSSRRQGRGASPRSTRAPDRAIGPVASPGSVS